MARFPTAADGTNMAPTWINYTGGDSLYSVQVTGAVTYAGGHNRWVNNECGANSICEANAVLVMGFAAIDNNTGLAIPRFHPMTLRGHGVKSLTAFPAGAFGGSNGGILLGDDVNSNGEGAYHGFNALFPLGSATSSPAFGSIPSGLFLTGRLGGQDESSAGVAAMCVDGSDPSAVAMATCTNGTSQNWTVNSDGTVTLSGQCLDGVGTLVELNSCTGTPDQQWSQGAGDTLVNEASGLCLDAPSPANGTDVTVAACSASGDQQWWLPAV